MKNIFSYLLFIIPTYSLIKIPKEQNNILVDFQDNSIESTAEIVQSIVRFENYFTLKIYF